MNVLIPLRDFLSRPSVEARYYGLAMRRAPDVVFHWPSRGPDLRLARGGTLPPNARPFPIDDPAGISALAARSLGVHAHLASPLFASLLASQGRHFDAVEVPSTIPVAHLVRPASEAFAVTVGAVVQNWLGSASEIARLDWPDPAGPEEIAQLLELEAISDSAVELRFAIAGTCPPCANGAPVFALAPDIAVAPGGAHDLTQASTVFAPPAPPDGWLGPFLRLCAVLPEPLRKRARLPADLTQDMRRALAADPIGRTIPQLARGETAATVDCAPFPLFSPAPLDTLRRGGSAILRKGCWSAMALDRIRPAAAPHGIDLDAPDAIDQFATALEKRPTGISDAEFGGGSLQSVYDEAGSLPLRLAPAPVHVDVGAQARHEFEASFPALRSRPEPQVSFILRAGDSELRAIAATLASLGRLVDLASEAIVVADETVGDARGLATVVRAAGGHARILHTGRNGGLLPVVDEARAPLVAFLMAGDRVVPRFGPWVLDALRDQPVLAAAPAWAALRAARPGPARPVIAAAGPVPGPAATFRRGVLAELGGTLDPAGIRDAMRRVVRYHGAGAIHTTAGDAPLAFSEDPSAYEGRCGP